MDGAERRRKLEEIRNNNQQLRRLVSQGKFDQVSSLASFMKRNLDVESGSQTNSIRLPNHTSAFYLIEPNKTEPRQLEDMNKKRPMLADKSPPQEVRPKHRKKSIHSFDYKAQELELNEVKQQKLNLELQVKTLSKEVQQLRQQLQQLKIQGNIPVFKCKEKINIFLTKIFVRNEDYDKIEYAKCFLELGSSTLVVYKDDETIWRTLELTTIKEVKYLNLRMLVEFQQNENSDYLFIAFQDVEQLHKWDFGMYINNFIQKHKDKQKIFWIDRQYPIETSPIKTLTRQPSPSISRRKLSVNLQQTTKQEPRRIIPQQPTRQERDYSADSKSKKYDSESYKTERTLEKFEANIMDNEPSEQEPTFRSPDKRNDGKKSSLSDSLNHRMETQKNRMDELSKDIMDKKKLIRQRKLDEKIEFKQPEEQPVESLSIPKFVPSQNENPQKATLQPISPSPNQLNLFPIEIKAQNGNNQINTSMISDDEAQSKKKEIIDRMQRKHRFTKYAKMAMKPHPKQVYLSQNKKQLCWQDVQSGVIKKIYVKNIIQIVDNEYGEGMKKHGKGLKKQNCMLIKTNDRVVQLYSQNTESIKIFAEGLDYIWKLNDHL